MNNFVQNGLLPKLEDTVDKVGTSSFSLCNLFRQLPYQFVFSIFFFSKFHSYSININCSNLHIFFNFSFSCFFPPQVLRHSKHILPTLARACLISTFIEDGIRMYIQWSEQREFMNMSWGCGYFLATMFVLFNLVGQLGGSVMVLIRYQVPYACFLLFLIIVVQVGIHQYM